MADDSEADADATIEGEMDEPTDDEVDNSTAEAEHLENGQQAAAGERPEHARGDETVPHVELELYELSVRVSGQSTDGLDEVEESATRLMDVLIEHARQLEDEPDTRGLS
ncbi:hypothetical protein [Haloferax larsenii]|uniref:Uncharacterized protein n=1 Tax=Haloferax larsenii TaxID=302484 RepID=A0A1H7SM88_HALLR|nr:hypothetical protein [Haloferax larsenii]SEL73499.1 hypothetical protein SAMN04488691_107133 [Haloferax larsenii]